MTGAVDPAVVEAWKRYDIRILLERSSHNLLGRLAQSGVDDLHARVPQRSGDDLGAPIVAVEARLSVNTA